MGRESDSRRFHICSFERAEDIVNGYDSAFLDTSVVRGEETAPRINAAW